MHITYMIRKKFNIVWFDRKKVEILFFKHFLKNLKKKFLRVSLSVCAPEIWNLSVGFTRTIPAPAPALCLWTLHFTYLNSYTMKIRIISAVFVYIWIFYHRVFTTHVLIIGTSCNKTQLCSPNSNAIVSMITRKGEKQIKFHNKGMVRLGRFFVENWRFS